MWCLCVCVMCLCVCDACVYVCVCARARPRAPAPVRGCPRVSLGFCWEWREGRLGAAAQGPLVTESMSVEEGDRREDENAEGRKKWRAGVGTPGEEDDASGRDARRGVAGWGRGAEGSPTGRSAGPRVAARRVRAAPLWGAPTPRLPPLCAARGTPSPVLAADRAVTSLSRYFALTTKSEKEPLGEGVGSVPRGPGRRSRAESSRRGQDARRQRRARGKVSDP